MKRKQFFVTATAATLGAAGGFGLGKARGRNVEFRSRDAEHIDGLHLDQYRNKYRSELLNRFIPNMDSYVIDHKYGGFMCTTDIRTGELLSTDKRAWYEGRGMWVYSFLYNNLEQNPAFLDVARKSKDFILKHQPDDNSFWVSSFSRQGEPLSEEPGDIYGNLFIAEGLAEYAKVTGEREYFDRAKTILLDCLDRYDQPDYSHRGGTPGTRLLGHWMVFLIGSTHMLQFEEDPEIERVADRCIDAIMNQHLNADYKLLNEYLVHDMSRPADEFAQYAYTGHGIETLWMVMYEAIRREDPGLFQQTAEVFRRHVEVARDAVYGGYFRSLDHVDNHTWRVDKVLWLQEEVLIGTMLLIEHLNDPWAKEHFVETYAYVQEKFVREGFKFWIIGGDRFLNDYNPARVGNYHHPRHLMLNLLSIERIIARGGKVSGLIL